MILLVGPPGSAKSTFCRQAVIKSLSEDRAVIFVTTEHGPFDVIQFLREEGLGQVPSGALYFVDGSHETVGLSTRDDTLGCSCSDLTSIEVAISKMRNHIGKNNILLVFDSLTSPYLLNGVEVIRFLRLSLAKFAAQGNLVLLCIDEDCGKPEEIGSMMSMMNGIIKMKLKGGSSVINIVKHPLVKPTTIRVPMSGIPSIPPTMSLESLNQKLDWIMKRLDFLEGILTEGQEFPEVVGFLRSLKIGTALFGEPLKTLGRLVSAKQIIESTSTQDEISRIIINAIALRGQLS